MRQGPLRDGRRRQGMRQGEDDIPVCGGVYVLVLRQPAPRTALRIGALGVLEFPRGYYCYVGSAGRGLRARVGRHLRGTGAVRWHVDYLRRRTAPVGALCWTDAAVGECELSRRVGLLADGTVPRFGSSDCDCPGHLHYFRRSPVARLRALAPEGMRFVRA